MMGVLDRELNNLKDKCDLNDWYGALLAVKDSYEILIKFSCLMACALSYQKNDDDFFFKLLTSPEHSMSLGDWTNDLLNIIRSCEYVKQDDDLKKYFKALINLINTTHIVTWRNDTLGHGVIKFALDEQMIFELMEKKDSILRFVASQQNVLMFFNSFCDKGRRSELSPFFLWNGDDMLFFDSMERDGSCKYLDIKNRRRVRKSERLWREKRRKFYSDLNVSTQTAPLSSGYSADLDTMLAAFHKAEDYEAADYLSQCVKQWLRNHPGGSFLLSADRGTGKSAFVYACDELQHHKGDQKIRLSDHTSTVAVRSYYASRTEILSPDEAEEHIIELLKNGPDGNLIRLRGNVGKPVAQMSFQEKVQALFQYYRSSGVDKLVIFIDGIDEINEENAGVLRCIPDGRDPLDGVYFIFTCRSAAEGIPATAISFCEKTIWTDIHSFDRRGENADLLRAYIVKHIDVAPDIAQRLAKRMDYRFSSVSLLPYMGQDTVQSLLNDTAQVDSYTILSKYLERLRCCYGSAYFHRMVRIAVIVAETPGEALSMQEVAWLAEDHALTSREVAFFYDLRPLLMEFRDYRGAVYGISNIGWVEALRELYPNILKEIALDWEEDLLTIGPKAEGAYAEAKWNALLYEASALICYFEHLHLHPSNEDLFDKIILVATRFKQGFQSHVLFRSLRCYSSLLQIYDRSLQEAYSANAMIKFLAIFNTCAKQYSDMCQEQQLLMIAKHTEEIIERYQANWKGDCDIALQVLSFYSNMICLHGELYQLEIGKSYCQKGRALHKKLQETWPEHSTTLNRIWSSFSQNAFSLLRYDYPGRALEMAKPLLEEMRKWQNGYRDINLGCSIAMCYMSSGDVLSAFCLLKECIDRLEQLPLPKNPDENEIYIVTIWRYCQRVHESYGQTDVTIEDIEKARNSVNQIMNYIVSVENAGYPDLSHWKPQIAMTEALICGRLAEIKSRSNQYSDEVHELLSEAVKITNYVISLYNDWDKNGMEYDRVSAMHNFMNAGAIYAEANMPFESIYIMENALQHFDPKNHTEEKVQQMIISKIDEIKEYFRIK